MRCACGDGECTIQISIDSVSATIGVERGIQRKEEDGSGATGILVQLDPNLTVLLIRQLRETLMQFTEE